MWTHWLNWVEGIEPSCRSCSLLESSTVSSEAYKYIFTGQKPSVELILAECKLYNIPMNYSRLQMELVAILDSET